MFTPSLYSASSCRSRSHLHSSFSTLTSTVYSKTSFDNSGCLSATNTNFTNNHQQKDYHQDINDFNCFFKDGFNGEIPNNMPYFVGNEFFNNFNKINDEVNSKPSMYPMSSKHKHESSSTHQNDQQVNQANENKQTDEYFQQIWSSIDLSKKKDKNSDADMLMNENTIISNTKSVNHSISINDSPRSLNKFSRPITKSYKQKRLETGKN